VNRTCTLKFFLDKSGSLALSVTHAETDGDDGAVEKHQITATDLWASEAAMTEAANRAISDWLGRLRVDAKKQVTPIERASA
jgi:hypothetical protein